jgi:hypothetical protein
MCFVLAEVSIDLTFEAIRRCVYHVYRSCAKETRRMLLVRSCQRAVWVFLRAQALLCRRHDIAAQTLSIHTYSLPSLLHIHPTTHARANLQLLFTGGGVAVQKTQQAFKHPPCARADLWVDEPSMSCQTKSDPLLCSFPKVL